MNDVLRLIVTLDAEDLPLLFDKKSNRYKGFSRSANHQQIYKELYHVEKDDEQTDDKRTH